MKSIFLALFLIPSLCFAAEFDYDTYSQRQEATKLLFFEVYKEYGARIRWSQVADVCGDKELSNQLAPLGKDTIKFLIDKIPQIKSSSNNNKASKYLSSISGDDTLTFLEGIDMALRMYGLGYKEAFQLSKPKEESFCKGALLEGYKELHKK